jgi:hypothetical protein
MRRIALMSVDLSVINALMAVNRDISYVFVKYCDQTEEIFHRSGLIELIVAPRKDYWISDVEVDIQTN